MSFQQLNHTCRQMQHRIVELLQTVQNEEVTCKLKVITLQQSFLTWSHARVFTTRLTTHSWHYLSTHHYHVAWVQCPLLISWRHTKVVVLLTGELLGINDELNNVFVRYDRFERAANAQGQGRPAAAAQVSPPAAAASQLPPSYDQAAQPVRTRFTTI